VAGVVGAPPKGANKSAEHKKFAEKQFQICCWSVSSFPLKVRVLSAKELLFFTKYNETSKKSLETDSFKQQTGGCFTSNENFINKTVWEFMNTTLW